MAVARPSAGGKSLAVHLDTIPQRDGRTDRTAKAIPCFCMLQKLKSHWYHKQLTLRNAPFSQWDMITGGITGKKAIKHSIIFTISCLTTFCTTSIQRFKCTSDV